MFKKVISVLLVTLVLTGCAYVQQLSATQQRNAHTVAVDGHLTTLNAYLALPTCSETVVAKCKDYVYAHGTVAPAKKAEIAALTNLRSAVATKTVTDAIQEAENVAFDTLKAVATGSVVTTALQ